MAWSTSAWNNDLMFENLASLWPNYRAHGATHLILARVLEDGGELARYRAAVPGAQITVCRLAWRQKPPAWSGCSSGCRQDRRGTGTCTGQ